MDVAIIIPCLNEESSITDAVRMALPIGPVFVVDSNSTDRTRALAHAAGATVVPYEWDGAYPKKKQWCLDNVATEYDWVLFLDADESPDPEMAKQIRDLAPPPAQGGYDIPLRYFWQGKELRHGYRVLKRSLINRHALAYPVVDDLKAAGMGEQEGHYQPTGNARVGRLSGGIVHDDRDNFNTWIHRHNRYSDWQAHISENGPTARRISLSKSLQGRVFSKAPFKSAAFFTYSYFLRLGFLDGRAGLDYALANAFYYWMIRVKREELRRQRPNSA